MGEEQLSRYALYMATLGNRPDLFPGSDYVGKYTSDPVEHEVPEEYLTDETFSALLTEAEKIQMCRIVTSAGADYIKTSTGFSTGGATFHDIALFAEHVRGRCKIKAAGGISTVEDIEKFLDLGADRLGTSRAVKLLTSGEAGSGY